MNKGVTLRTRRVLFGASYVHKNLIVTGNQAAVALPDIEHQR
jgi:hypothetical protein